MAKKIRITFSDGKATVTAHGFKGKACVDATKSFEQALGVVTSDVKTREYNEQEVTHDRTVER